MLSQRSILLWSPQQHRVCIPHICSDRKDPDSPGPIPYNFFLRNLQKNCRKLQNFDKLNGKFQSKITNESLISMKKSLVNSLHSDTLVYSEFDGFDRLIESGIFFKTPKVHISLMCDVKFFLLKNGPSPASFLIIFVLFTFQFKWQICNLNNTDWKNCRRCAWDSNAGWQDSGCRRIHWALAARKILSVNA